MVCGVGQYGHVNGQRLGSGPLDDDHAHEKHTFHFLNSSAVSTLALVEELYFDIILKELPIRADPCLQQMSRCR